MDVPRSTLLRLRNELRELLNNRGGGFHIFPPSEDNMLVWKVAIFGPPETIYQGGYFVAQLEFPHDYPFSPPSLRFIRPPLHPNIYSNGDVCISILHPSDNEASSGEKDSERWTVTQSVRTILLSIVSMLNEPNLSSPANVDASRMYRAWKDSNDNEYITLINRQIEESRIEAEKDGVFVPQTQDQYLGNTRQDQQIGNSESSSANQGNGGPPDDTFHDGDDED